uniref:Helicase MOV-10 Ig-like domain-containing protein n=1 Tax=Ciona savignyi TaxID=51511 RepID=H2Z1U5_CIOSA
MSIWLNVAECFIRFLESSSGHERFLRDELVVKFNHFKKNNGVNMRFSSILHFLLQEKFIKMTNDRLGNEIFCIKIKGPHNQSNEENERNRQKNDKEKNKFLQYISNPKNRSKLLDGPTDLEIVCSHPECEVGNGIYKCDLKDSSAITYKMLVRNKGNFCIVLKKCFLFREHDVIRITDEIGCCNLKADIEVELPAGSEYPIVVTCLSKEKLGCYSADVIFTFERIDVKRTKFHLLRLLECRRTSDLSETLKAESEYKRPSMKFNRDNLIGITFAEK